MAAVPTATHPKCGKTFPGGDSAGHCSACCETFIGKASFDAHRVGEHGVDRRCELKPYTSYRTEYPHTIVYGHWEDARGNWHYGKQLTKDESKALFSKRTA